MDSTSKDAQVVSVPPWGASKATTMGQGSFLAFALGLTLLTTYPTEGSADFMRMQLLSVYVVTYFDFVVVFSCLIFAACHKFQFERSERALFQTLALVTLTRILSLLFASTFLTEQSFSLFRYFSTLVILLLLANLLRLRKNRRLFLAGMIAGTVVETVGNLFVFFSSQGETRGYWLGLDNYKIQVFLLVACCVSLSQKKNRLWKIMVGLFLLLGILATETRTALILLLICLFLLFLTRGRKMLKPVFVLLVLVGVAVVPVLLLLPGAAEGLNRRVEQVWTGEGSIGYRIILFEMAAAAYLTHPITGIGSGGFARQQNTLYLQIRDAFASEYEALDLQVSTHNTVLGVAAETGTVGLIAYFLWVAAVMRTCIHAIRLERTHHDLYVLASCVCLLAMLTQDWWGQASFMPVSTCLLGFVMGWCRNRRAPMPLGSRPTSVGLFQARSTVSHEALLSGERP